MDIELTFTLQQFLSGLLLLAAAIAVIALIFVFIRLFKALGKLNTILDDCSDSITRTVNTLPDITEKVDDALDNVSSVTETVADVADDAGEFVGKVVNGPANDVVDLLEIFSGLIRALKNYK